MGEKVNLHTVRAEARRQEIMDTAFRLFTEKSIEGVTFDEIAKATGHGIATIFRHFPTKATLVLAVAEKVWGEYTSRKYDTAVEGKTAAEVFEFYLDSFIDQYQNHRDLLRFNQLFNIYVKGEGIPAEDLDPYHRMIDALEERFHRNYLLGQQDGTLRTEAPEKEMFSATLHLMLAVVTRYAVGLVYDSGIDPMRELELQKEMLMQRYTVAAKRTGWRTEPCAAEESVDAAYTVTAK